MSRAALRMFLCCLASFVLLGSTAVSAEEFIPEVTEFEGLDLSYQPFHGGCDVSADGRWVAGPRVGDEDISEKSLTVIDLETGSDVTYPTSQAINQVQISDDGRYVTFGSKWHIQTRGLPTSLRQLDTQTGQIIDLVPGAAYVDFLETTPSGDIVFWSQFSAVGKPGLKKYQQFFVWDRATGTLREVTPVEGAGLVDTGLPGEVPAQILEIGEEHVVWHPLSGRAVPIVDPFDDASMYLVGVAPAGDRLLYMSYGFAHEKNLVVASPSGAVLGQTANWFGNDIYPPEFFFSDDGTTVLVDTNRMDVGRDTLLYRFVWDLTAGTITDLVIDMWRFCGASRDLRWLVADGDSWNVTAPMRIDLYTEGAVPVDPDEVAGPQLSDQIARLYQAYFLRPPDASGMYYWRLQRASGKSLHEVSEALSQSPEFQARYGQLGDGPFVRLLYRNVLERTPNSQETAFWIDEMRTSMTRGSVMVAFSESKENVATTQTTTPVFDYRLAQVERLYRAHFERSSDGEGLSFWFHQLRLGRTLDDMASEFARSPEFEAKYGQLSDAEFVDRIYLNVLGRAGETEGRLFWIEALGRGASRGSVMIEFSESPEFVLLTDTLPSH